MFFDRHQGGEAAILVHLELNERREQEYLQEFTELVRSAGVQSLELITAHCRHHSPEFFVGSGKVEEIRQLVILHDADVVLFNHALSPSQERNLEKVLKCRVVDRTELILDIFAQRARTFEGKLQVELAQLQHMSTRLVRGWTHLERQKGGIGLRGPGETQIETDRRLIGVRIKSISQRLEKVRKQRDQGRRSRQRSDVHQIALVGYTNAGKSTLFGRVTESSVYAADQLFATLDPTLRRINLPSTKPMVLVDTVGFIRHLPHKLVDAFRATLEEISHADLILHIIDSHSQERLENIEQVNAVLKEINAHELPQLQVLNKIDLLKDVVPTIQRDDEGKPYRVLVSAVDGRGIDLLLEAVKELLAHDMIHGQLILSPVQFYIRARLYKMGVIQAEAYSESGDIVLDVHISKNDWERFAKQEGLNESCMSFYNNLEADVIRLKEGTNKSPSMR